MWRSQTLPRRPSELPPLPPHRPSGGTLTRSERNVDVQRLREDIEILSRQLSLVRAQLDDQIDQDIHDQMEAEPTINGHDTVDSRLSTVLFSPVSARSRDTPTPQPTRLSIPIDSYPTSNVSTLRKSSQSMSTSFLSNPPVKPSQSLRMSICVPSTSIIVPRIKRRETFSKADGLGERNTLKQERMKRADSFQSLGPPKPLRTFAETLDRTLQRKTVQRTQDTTNQYLNSTICSIPDCSDEELAKLIKERFNRGQCWFSRGGEVLFVNPFTDISSSKHVGYRAISTITSSLLSNRNSALVLRGVSGSGKSQLSELACLDLADRLELKGPGGEAFYAALMALRPILTVNTRNNNQCSRAVHHYELQVRDHRLLKIVLRHFLLESPSRGCRANIFAMLANDLSENDKERFRISGFQLRENYTNYGSLDDFKAALMTLGISVVDVFTVLAACTLLNNLVFKEIKGFVDIENLSDLEDASHLLGLSSLSLYRTLMNGTLDDASIFQSQRVRDDLVSSIYSRLVSLVLRKANRALENLEITEDESCFNDSGIGLASGDRSVVHIIDIPGYVKTNNNSLTELLVNAINDNLDGRNKESSSKLLQNIELAHQVGTDRFSKRTIVPVSHCDGNFIAEYETAKMAIRNNNIICRELVSLFDIRSCSFHFIAKLFAADVEKLRVDCSTEPCAVIWNTEQTTVIKNVLDSTKTLQMIMDQCDIQYIHCLKSNDRLEFARISETGICDQLRLFDGISRRPTSVFSPQTRSPPMGTSVLATPVLALPTLPAPRNYEIRDGKKHMFPQRRNIIVDFVDQSSGVSLRAGEVVKAIGFSGECYLIETGRKNKAAVPISFTEKSLPPTEGYCV